MSERILHRQREIFRQNDRDSRSFCLKIPHYISREIFRQNDRDSRSFCLKISRCLCKIRSLITFHQLEIQACIICMVFLSIREEDHANNS